MFQKSIVRPFVSILHPIRIYSPSCPVFRMFHSKTEVILFVCETSVLGKKHFCVVRNEHRRYALQCPNEECCFYMNFFKKLDGCFHSVDERPHTRDDVFPTVKKVSVCWKVKLLPNQRRTVAPSEHSDWFSEKYEIDIKKPCWQGRLETPKPRPCLKRLHSEHSFISSNFFPWSMRGQQRTKVSQTKIEMFIVFSFWRSSEPF